MESKKEMIQMNLLAKQKETHRLGKQTYGCRAGQRVVKGMVRESGTFMYTLLYSKWMTNKDLLYSTWNSIDTMLCGSLAGRGILGRIDTCMCG